MSSSAMSSSATSSVASTSLAAESTTISSESTSLSSSTASQQYSTSATVTSTTSSATSTASSTGLSSQSASMSTSSLISANSPHATSSSLANPLLSTAVRVVAFTTTIAATATEVTFSISPQGDLDTPAQRKRIEDDMKVAVGIVLTIYGILVLFAGWTWSRRRYQERVGKHMNYTIPKEATAELVSSGNVVSSYHVGGGTQLPWLAATPADSERSMAELTAHATTSEGRARQQRRQSLRYYEFAASVAAE